MRWDAVVAAALAEFATFDKHRENLLETHMQSWHAETTADVRSQQTRSHLCIRVHPCARGLFAFDRLCVRIRFALTDGQIGIDGDRWLEMAAKASQLMITSSLRADWSFGPAPTELGRGRH